MINWLAIATTAVSIITPLVKKAGEEFAGKTGEEIFSLIRRKFTGDKEAENALKNFEEKPERYGGVLTDVLREKIEADTVFAQTLLKLVENANGDYNIQQIAKGKGISQTIGSGTSSVSISGNDFVDQLKEPNNV